MKPRTRNLIVFAAKVVIATLLIGWLVSGGNLDLHALSLFVERPTLLVYDLTLFSFGAFIGSYRFRVLLRIAGVDVKVGVLLRLQLTAFFFNVVIPGNIGGDVVKALYVARDEAADKRTTILLLVFVERLLGVSALVFVGTLFALARLKALWGDPLLRPLSMTVVALGACTFLGGALAFLVVRHAGDRLDVYTSGPSKLSKLLNQLVASMRIVSAGPRQIAIALALSMSNHVAAILFFTLLTRTITGDAVPAAAVATVFPLGLLTLLLPISPSGLGVGHVAFKRLFEAIGLSGGATVFNVYLLGQIVPCLCGVFPFLSLRKRGELPAE